MKSACAAGSPDNKDTIPIIKGPTIGTLPKNLERNGLALLNAGAINFAATLLQACRMAIQDRE